MAALTKEAKMYSLLTESVASALIEDRRRQAAQLRRARVVTPGVRWFRKPASERVAQAGEIGQAQTSAPCVNCG
jgi:hypothetical protein